MFDKAGIPCGPVLNMQEAIDHPHIKAREMMVTIEHPTIGEMYFQGVPIKLSQTPGSVETPAPLLGQHNAEVLKEFGVDEKELKILEEQGII